ncbi:Hypothetical protein CINCED_3A023175 [Cinara cedri]|uniref:Uncharacterized protein n=1 Tax=Cinara cedri TaxID=506608 RepID=A0A5E4M034_9HEMI|nr:Hypothetical protein CINCED_3A023175 [Cinara cedri]
MKNNDKYVSVCRENVAKTEVYHSKRSLKTTEQESRKQKSKFGMSLRCFKRRYSGQFAIKLPDFRGIETEGLFLELKTGILKL